MISFIKNKPDQQIPNMKHIYRLCPFQYAKICNLDGDHGCKHRSNKIQKIGYSSKWQEDCTNCSDDGYCNRNQLSVYLS